jgi:hypothetical protein
MIFADIDCNGVGKAAGRYRLETVIGTAITELAIGIRAPATPPAIRENGAGMVGPTGNRDCIGNTDYLTRKGDARDRGSPIPELPEFIPSPAGN